MPRQPSLSPGAIRAIHAAVDNLFDKAKVRLCGPESVDKRIYVGYVPELSLPGLFLSASREEAVVPNLDTMQSLLKIASGYLDAERERTKAQVVKAVDGFLKGAAARNVETNVETVLGGELTKVWGRVETDVRRIVETEATTVRNVGVLDGILKINDVAGVDDSVVGFIVVNDQHLCDECRRLHLLDDGVTPRLWHLSDVSHQYHKRGEDSPSIGGLHPHCRCSIFTCMPGYGFKNGAITFIGVGHDEYARQHDEG